MGAFVVLYSDGRRARRPTPRPRCRATSTSTATARSWPAPARSTARSSTSTKIPKDVQHTFVAAENKTFYKDPGVDFKGTARGLINTLVRQGQAGWLDDHPAVRQELLPDPGPDGHPQAQGAGDLPQGGPARSPRTTSSPGYINTSYYGRGAYGIQAAAQAYYRIDAEKLTVAQGAYLAALLQAPSQYDWAVATRHRQEAGHGPLELRPRQHGRGGLAGRRPSATA